MYGLALNYWSHDHASPSEAALEPEFVIKVAYYSAPNPVEIQNLSCKHTNTVVIIGSFQLILSNKILSLGRSTQFLAREIVLCLVI